MAASGMSNMGAMAAIQQTLAALGGVGNANGMSTPGGLGSGADMAMANNMPVARAPLIYGGSGSPADMVQANQQPGPASTSGQQVTLQDLLNALVGPAPTAPTAADFGAAPTLADYYSAAPYQQALNQLATNQGTAATTIGQAYNAAAASQAQAVAQSQASTSAAQNQANADAAHAQQQVQGYANAAAQGAGAGNGVQARLAAVQGTVAAQSAAAQGLNAQLAGIQKNNVAQDSSMSATSQQNALNYLAAQITGAKNQVGLQQTAAQTQGQQLLQQALNARAVSEASANKDYESSLATHQSSIDDLLKSATSTASSGSETYAQQADDQLAQWQQAGAAGDSNANTLYSVANGAIYGGKTGQCQTIDAPKNQAQAMQLLTQMAPAIGGVGSSAFTQATQVVKNHFSTGKAAVSSSDIMQVLASMLGAGGTSS